jgi:hypothetical protein
MLDFTQAFDIIAHDMMVCKMRYSDEATALLGSYLSDRMQCVRSQGENSTVRARGIEYGVFQSTVLGPLLFISFIDDVSGVIYVCRFQIFADNLQIHYSFSVANLQRCYDEVNADLKQIDD